MKKMRLEIVMKNSMVFELEIPQSVFEPSFMTQQLLKAVSQVEDLPENPSILDLGTGSGIIAIALSQNLNFKNIYVSDVLPETLEVAKRNFKKYDVKPKVVFLSDLFSEIPIKFDLVIFNPPAYPKSLALQINNGLDISIFSGSDGRYLLEKFINEIGNHLNPGGQFLSAIPSFLDRDYFVKLLRHNKLEYRETTSNICSLPTYGYPKEKFLENFRMKYNGSFYADGNANYSHYRINHKTEEIQFRVHTICGFRNQ